MKSPAIPSSVSPARANAKKPGAQTVLWWVLWITLTIASFFAASAVWTPVIARRFGSVRETRNSVIWIAAVFGTWMVFLVPLIVWMYRRVDKTYEDARIRREKAAHRFRSVRVDPAKRGLPAPLAAKLADWPEAIEGGHLVNVLLKDGRKIPNVYIFEKREILGIYDCTEMTFEAADILDLEPEDLVRLPQFSAANWLRLDGVTAD